MNRSECRKILIYKWNLYENVIAKADVEKLIQYSKEHDSKESDMGMDYDTGHSSMVYSRGNILLGKGIFMKSLRVSKLRRCLVNLLF